MKESAKAPIIAGLIGLFVLALRKSSPNRPFQLPPPSRGKAMTTPPISPLARQVPGVRDPKLGRSRARAWGLLLHTTGGGVTDKAKKLGKTPIAVAIETYINSQNGANGYFWGGPGYVLEHDGTLHQLAPDNIVTAHAGGPHRDQYLDGTWLSKVSPSMATEWHRQWSVNRNPYSLFPSRSPNEDYIGVEMIPCGDGFGIPMRPGLRFTQAQFDTVIALGSEMGKRHIWPVGWQKTARLLGHEDVDPIERHDSKGGWDPGWLRASPYFDFDYVRSRIS